MNLSFSLISLTTRATQVRSYHVCSGATVSPIVCTHHILNISIRPGHQPLSASIIARQQQPSTVRVSPSPSRATSTVRTATFPRMIFTTWPELCTQKPALLSGNFDVGSLTQGKTSYFTLSSKDSNSAESEMIQITYFAISREKPVLSAVTFRDVEGDFDPIKIEATANGTLDIRSNALKLINGTSDFDSINNVYRLTP